MFSIIWAMHLMNSGVKRVNTAPLKRLNDLTFQRFNITQR